MKKEKSVELVEKIKLLEVAVTLPEKILEIDLKFVGVDINEYSRALMVSLAMTLVVHNRDADNDHFYTEMFGAYLLSLRETRRLIEVKKTTAVAKVTAEMNGKSHKKE